MTFQESGLLRSSKGELSILEGTVSEGTLKPEDLIPVFADEYVRLSGNANRVKSFHKHVKEFGKYIYHDPYCFECGSPLDRFGQPVYIRTLKYTQLMDNLQWDLEELFDLLNGLAPEGYYFGAHEGDGADFGFWKTEEEE